MINRDNWLDIKEYLNYLKNIKLVDDQTIKRRYDQLVHLLLWADSRPLGDAAKIMPVFPVFLQTSRRDGKVKSLSPETMRATCNVVRNYFTWAKKQLPRKYGKIDPSWIDYIQPAKSRGIQSTVKDHEFYTFDEMHKIVQYQPQTLLEERDRAAMCFIYLSAIRASAFTSLPISCVDIEKRTVLQYPEMGVRTKNHKAARTVLFRIPELLQVCQEWDDKVRSQLPESAMWYSSIDKDGETLVPLYDPNIGRREKLTDGIIRICAQVGIKYKSPHKLRHGNIVYGVKNAKGMAGLKAVSQNAMHENVEITNKVYGALAGDDVREAIDQMFPDFNSDNGNETMEREILELAEFMKKHPNLLDAFRKE